MNKAKEIYKYLKINGFPVSKVDLKNFENILKEKEKKRAKK